MQQLEVLVSGAIAGIFANALCHPLDTIKTLTLQLDTNGSPKHAGPLQALRTVMRSTGLQGLYRGYGTVMLTSVPGSGVYFLSLDTSTKLTKRLTGLQDSSILLHVISGVWAQILAGAVFTPIDVVKERLQVASNTFKHVVSNIYLNHGILGFWRGYVASVALWAPYGAIYLSSNQLLKNLFHSDAITTDSFVGFMWHLGLSVASATIAASLTTCIDVVKINLQISDRVQFGKRPSALSMAIHLFKQRGVAFFFNGSSARVLYLAPRTAISFVAYDTVLWWLKRNE